VGGPCDSAGQFGDWRGFELLVREGMGPASESAFSGAAPGAAAEGAAGRIDESGPVELSRASVTKLGPTVFCHQIVFCHQLLCHHSEAKDLFTSPTLGCCRQTASVLRFAQDDSVVVLLADTSWDCD
jgi:hypothetical protein